MTAISQNLVSSSDIRRLTHGSYEYQISKIHEESLGAIAERLGVESGDLQPLATHKDRMVVRLANEFYVAQFAEADTGERYLTRCEVEPVPVYDDLSKSALAEQEVEAAVDAYLNGDVTRALHRIEEAVPFVPSGGPQSQAQTCVTIERVLDRPRVWKQVLENRYDRITRYIVNELVALEENRLVPKFRSLYEENIDESELGVYADVVNTDLDYVVGRYRSLETTLSNEIDNATESVAKARKKSGDVVELYEKFAADLLDDVQSVNRFLARVEPKLTGVEYRGKLRDTLVERLQRYEIAGCFVVNVAGRLAQTV